MKKKGGEYMRKCKWMKKEYQNPKWMNKNKKDKMQNERERYRMYKEREKWKRKKNFNDSSEKLPTSVFKCSQNLVCSIHQTSLNST